MKSTGRFLLAGALLLFAGLAAISQTGQKVGDGKLQGDVADMAENAPIQYAFILVHSGSRKEDVTAKVDANGQYELQLAPGLYDVFVAAEGFAPSCKKVQVVVDGTTTFRARLKPDTEHLQSSLH
jgi:hypothetical protein